MDKRDVLFNQKLKEIQKAHKPEKWAARKPYNWIKQWGPFIKYDADWDGEYLFDLILYKLEKMYIGLDAYSDEVREDLDKRLATLQKVIDLGKKIQTSDYNIDSQVFCGEHIKRTILIYKHSKVKNVRDGKFVYQTYSDEELIHEMSGPDVQLTTLFFEKDVKYIGKHNLMGSEAAYQWAVDNGYRKKDIHLAYASEWDTQENYQKWLVMLEKEEKTKQKDINKFFKLISEHFQKWWW